MLQMKDIYKRAERIILWLGDASDDDLLGFRYVSQRRLPDNDPTPRQCPSRGNSMSDEEPSDEMLHEIREARFVSLKSLLSRSYWRRAWVIQEATTRKAASQIAVWCGASSSTFDNFVPKAQLSMS